MNKDLQNKEDIIRLINLFYEKVKSDLVLSPIFNNPAHMNWQNHIPVMVEFWEAQISRRNDYKSDFIEKHQTLHKKVPLKKKHFDQWLKLFHDAVNELFIGEQANWIKMRASSMSTMMMLKIVQLSNKQGNDTKK